MEAKELLVMIISYENDIDSMYDDYCIGDITKVVYKNKQKVIVNKQFELIKQYKKDVLTDFRENLKI